MDSISGIQKPGGPGRVNVAEQEDVARIWERVSREVARMPPFCSIRLCGQALCVEFAKESGFGRYPTD